ncbi:hypothetical protein K0M31_000376 [Melipona bicolor]|uniref:Uncharacterized protein n=1 Tax=Melipona bicolor TaxID=60889 RepID=A0AA40GDQ4_9HYME|nr:hypothetical protein K0M31_000376 [Melipona bicolor]
MNIHNREDSLAAKVTEDTDTVRTKRRSRNLRYSRGLFASKRNADRWGNSGWLHGRRVLTCLNRPSILNEETSYQSSIPRRLGSDTEESEGYSITREIGRSVLWPRKQREFCFLWEPSPQNHSLCSLGQSTQKPITGFPSVLPQHGKRISFRDIPSWTSLNDSLF